MGHIYKPVAVSDPRCHKSLTLFFPLLHSGLENCRVPLLLEGFPSIYFRSLFGFENLFFYSILKNLQHSNICPSQ